MTQGHSRRVGYLRALPSSAREIELSFRGKPPPHDLDAEASVLSAMMLSRPAVLLVHDILRPEQFYSDANRHICEAIYALLDDGNVIDLVTVADRLREQSRLAQIGGPKYLAQVADATPAHAHVEAHAAIVVEHAQLRAYQAELWRQLHESYDPLALPGVVWRDQGAGKLNELAQHGHGSQTMTVGEAIDVCQHEDARATSTPGVITGLPTGLIEVDKATGGLHPGEVTMLCAATGKGKSSCAHSIVVNVARNPIVEVTETIWGADEEHPEGWVERKETRTPRGVVVFSLDNMKAPEITRRMACSMQKVDSVKLKNGTATMDDWRRLTEAYIEIRPLPILISDDTSLTPLVLRAKLRASANELKTKYGATLALVIIDYVQLMGCDGDTQGLNDEQKLNRIGKSLLRTAEGLNVPILLISQLNEKGATRDCAALEMHAQNKWVITWKALKPLAPVPGMHRRHEPHFATIDIEKCRNGRTGKVHTRFHQTYTLYSDDESS